MYDRSDVVRALPGRGKDFGETIERIAVEVAPPHVTGATVDHDFDVGETSCRDAHVEARGLEGHANVAAEASRQERRRAVLGRLLADRELENEASIQPL